MDGIPHEIGFTAELYDYSGLPTNAADRMRFDAGDISEWSIPEFVCRPHPGVYNDGDIMTVTTYLDDPVYMDEPHLQSISFRRNLHQELPFFPCTVGVENVAEAFPHFLPGKNPYVADAAKKFGLPLEAIKGGKATITDADNLREPFVQSTHFKRLAPNAAFKPEACEGR